MAEKEIVAGLYRLKIMLQMKAGDKQITPFLMNSSEMKKRIGRKVDPFEHYLSKS